MTSHGLLLGCNKLNWNDNTFNWLLCLFASVHICVGCRVRHYLLQNHAHSHYPWRDEVSQSMQMIPKRGHSAYYNKMKFFRNKYYVFGASGELFLKYRFGSKSWVEMCLFCNFTFFSLLVLDEYLALLIDIFFENLTYFFAFTVPFREQYSLMQRRILTTTRHHLRSEAWKYHLFIELSIYFIVFSLLILPRLLTCGYDKRICYC